MAYAVSKPGEPDPPCLPYPESGEHLFPLCRRIYGNVELLYWSVEEGALDYAVAMKNNSWAPPTDSLFNFASGKTQKANFDFNPGYRVLLGYYNAPKYWELFAEYTRFNTSGHDKVCKPEVADLYLNGTFPQLSDDAGFFLEEAKSSINLHYQVFDILFSRVFDPNPHLRMRLIAGLTTAFIDQDWTVTYLDNESNTTKIKNDWSYSAGGLRVGFIGDWWWIWNLYLTGKVSIAGFAGRYSNHAKQSTDYLPTPDFDIQNNVSDLKYKDYRYAQHLQFIFGPSWQIVGNRCCPDFELFIGYELNGWFNLQEVMRSTNGEAHSTKEIKNNTGALALHGLTLRLTIGY